MNSRGQTWHVPCSVRATVARAYFNDVDEEFFRAGDDIADQRAQRSYSDLTEYEGMGPGVVRRAVDRIVRARRVLIIAGVFLGGGITGFAIARLSADAPADAPAAAVVAESTVASPAAASPAPVLADVPPPAAQPAPAPMITPPAAVPVVAKPVVAKPVAAKPVAAKPTAKPARRAASRSAAKPRPRPSPSDAPVFPY